jgi:hypothetical protein
LNSSITDPVSFFLLSSGAVFALVWALGQCLERRTGSLSYLSAATLASAGLWLLSGAHFFSGLYQAFPHLLLVHLPVVACIGPCLYFYYRKLIHPSIPIRPRDVAHFVPAILVAVALIPFYSLSPGEKIEIATGIRKDLLAKWFGVLNAFPKLSAIGYLSAFAIRNRFLLSLRAPSLEVEGEMHGDAAISDEIRARIFPNSKLKGAANLLVMPNLDAANIAYNLIKVMGDGLSVGPILIGVAQPAHILTPSVTVRGIINMTAVAAVEAQTMSKRQRVVPLQPMRAE